MKARALEEMKKNGVNAMLQSKYVMEIAKLVQNTEFDCLKMYKQPKKEKEYKIANALVLQFLKEMKMNNTIETIEAESLDFSSLIAKSPEKDLKLKKDAILLTTLVDQWDINPIKTRKENHSRFRAKLQKRLNDVEKGISTDESVKPAKGKKEEEAKPSKAAKSSPKKEEKKKENEQVTSNIDQDINFDSYDSDDIPDLSKAPPAAKPETKKVEPEKPKTNTSAAAKKLDAYENSFDAFDIPSSMLSDDKSPAASPPPAKTQTSTAAAAKQSDKSKISNSSDLNLSFVSTEDDKKSNQKADAKPAKAGTVMAIDDDDMSSNGSIDFDDQSPPTQKPVTQLQTKQPEKTNPVDEPSGSFSNIEFDSDSSPEPPKPAATKPPAKAAPKEKSGISSSLIFDDLDDDDNKEPPKPAAKPAPAPKSPDKDDDPDVDIDFSSDDFDL